jgi:predicted small lipoprotein YifL
MKKQSAFVLMAALALCGCGQKGPLYLPEHNDVVITAPVSPESTEATPQPLPEESSSSSSSSSSSARRSSGQQSSSSAPRQP